MTTKGRFGVNRAESIFSVRLGFCVDQNSDQSDGRYGTTFAEEDTGGTFLKSHALKQAT
jgi:hypothetical protein